MGQNRSSAVMQQRKEPHNSLEDFPTPPWATRALCEQLRRLGRLRRSMSVREPAANRGHMVRPLLEYVNSVEAADVHDYGAGFPVQDYLFGPLPAGVDWTICNPPFRLAEQFIDRALQTSRVGCAFLVRTAFLEGVGRYNRLFAFNRPTIVMQFSERVVMHKGKLSAKGSTATAYAWCVWLSSVSPARETELHWIGPCRTALERPDDYAGEVAL